ncbi:hypothetical protein EXT48_10435 [Pseudoalteromonas sp. CO348]|uniref:Ig-like domain-containing protein n=1 Tax=Pseudoalteromonas TaxID=53246 RepID=UPI001023176D|nr:MULTISPECIES: Ig-like domain-containing protein [Pseudoalteromonas]MCG9769891.1 Ig-like domain-containing protein [Pseudoalteromonas piscicida]RZG04764.1 hypothetical protein EXT48_10435 [Pseudoalteromonas sp. CO348]
MKLRKCIFTLAVGMCATALPAAPINTEYQYDELGRLTKTLDTKNGVRSYEYDAAGNRKKVTAADDNSNSPPNAQDDSITLNGLYSPKTLDVLANDSDPDGDTLQVSATDASGTLSVTINDDNTLTITAVGFQHPEQRFIYTITDNNGGVSQATVTVYTQ